MLIDDHPNIDLEEHYTKLYVPDFLVGNSLNENMAYLGTNKGNIFILSVTD